MSSRSRPNPDVQSSPGPKRVRKYAPRTRYGRASLSTGLRVRGSSFRRMHNSRRQNTTLPGSQENQGERFEITRRFVSLAMNTRRGITKRDFEKFFWRSLEMLKKDHEKKSGLWSDADSNLTDVIDNLVHNPEDSNQNMSPLFMSLRDRLPDTSDWILLSSIVMQTCHSSETQELLLRHFKRRFYGFLPFYG